MKLLFSLAAAVWLLSADPALARTTCQDTLLGRLCTSEVNFTRFQLSAYEDQLQSQWCWAASISMVYNYYGYSVSQDRIVSDVYGSPVNMPALAGAVLANQLNREWTDDRGERFRSRVTGLYDADAGLLSLSNSQIIAELDRDRPLVIGARTHAMVLTAIQYYDTIFGPNVVAAGVFDPWPGIGARNLAQDELTALHLGGSLRFLASVKVTRIEPPVPVVTPTVDSSDGGGGSVNLPILLACGVAVIWRRRKRLACTQSPMIGQA